MATGWNVPQGVEMCIHCVAGKPESDYQGNNMLLR